VTESLDTPEVVRYLIRPIEIELPQKGKWEIAWIEGDPSGYVHRVDGNFAQGYTPDNPTDVTLALASLIETMRDQIEELTATQPHGQAAPVAGQNDEPCKKIALDLAEAATKDWLEANQAVVPEHPTPVVVDLIARITAVMARALAQHADRIDQVVLEADGQAKTASRWYRRAMFAEAALEPLAARGAEVREQDGSTPSKRCSVDTGDLMAAAEVFGRLDDVQHVNFEDWVRNRRQAKIAERLPMAPDDTRFFLRDRSPRMEVTTGMSWLFAAGERPTDAEFKVDLGLVLMTLIFLAQRRGLSLAEAERDAYENLLSNPAPKKD